jgi:TfoX/Sxy family transcriptional regulator of competence genes
MAYDEALADRIRQLIAAEPGLSEKKMFGGLAFLIHGNMAIGASGQGGLLVHVDSAETDTLLATTNARMMEMRGRRMASWLRVNSEDVSDDDELHRWVKRGSAYARALPPKN